MYESARSVRERIITTEILRLERRLAAERAERGRAAPMPPGRRGPVASKLERRH